MTANRLPPKLAGQTLRRCARMAESVYGIVTEFKYGRQLSNYDSLIAIEDLLI